MLSALPKLTENLTCKLKHPPSKALAHHTAQPTSPDHFMLQLLELKGPDISDEASLTEAVSKHCSELHRGETGWEL